MISLFLNKIYQRKIIPRTERSGLCFWPSPTIELGSCRSGSLSSCFVPAADVELSTGQKSSSRLFARRICRLWNPHRFSIFQCQGLRLFATECI